MFELGGPPIVNPLELAGLITMVADGESLRFLMRPWFDHPLGLGLTFEVDSSDAQGVQVGSYGSTLILSGLRSGEVALTMTAVDGFAQEVEAVIRVLVYPEPLELFRESYSFGATTVFPALSVLVGWGRRDPSG